MAPNEVGSSGNETWSSVEELFWDHMKEVQNKWNTLKLNDDIWAKLIYFEQNRRLAKAYVSAPVLTVDGSINGLDGFRIGLSGIENAYRNLESIGCLRSIGQGVKLKIDNQGNILIRKIGQHNLADNNNPPSSSSACSVWIKDWPTQISTTTTTRANSQSGSSIENCMMREILSSDTSYKLFDMQKFRLQLEERKLNDDNVLDWRQCVSIISFVRATGKQNRSGNILEDPCWLMIINIIAIDMLKSSVCDTKVHSLHKKQTSQNLTKTHRLLDGKDQFSDRSISVKNTTATREPLRASSSASILAPQENNANSNVDDLDYPELADSSERIKKLRITNGRFRFALDKGNNLSRRYQSTQQLSSNNSIYTTFNSKFLNQGSKFNQRKQRQLADVSSTSDYNSASRSTSSKGNQRYYKQRSIDSPRYRIDTNNQMKEENNERRLLDFNGKKMSQSAIDLSQKRLDLRSMHSAIKMNFDKVDEVKKGAQIELKKVDKEQDNYIVTTNEDELCNKCVKLMLNERRKLLCCCNLTTMGRQKNCSSDKLSNDICRALEGRKLSELESKEAQQKVSRTSIASSSSSSGCADNDYFMSQSSSSMTSSTASNERELFSQPASSSGIVCSGNTSDEYESNRKPLSTHSDDVVSPSSPKSDTSSSGVEARGKKESSAKRATGGSYGLRRANRIKTIGFCCDEYSLSNQQHEQECACPPIEQECYYCCDCLLESTGGVETPPISSRGREPIHSRLQCISPTSINDTKKTQRSISERRRIQNSSSTTNISRNSSLIKEGDNRDSTCSHEQQIAERLDKIPKDTQRQSGSWLDKCKYSKILPRFMFSSSGNRDDYQMNQQQQRNKSTQLKSGTLDKNDKFRLTKSSLNMS